MDEQGVSEEFTSEWQANDYLQEVKKAVAEKESAEWMYVEQSKLAAKVEADVLTDEEFAAKYLIPGQTVVELHDSTFRVESVDLSIDKVELRDVTFANAVGFPIFRAENIGMVRHLLEQQMENQVQQPDHFIHHYYVVEDLQVRGALQLKEYGTFEEAMAAYQSLPTDKIKGLGVQNTRTPLPGSLNLIQCKDGQDTLIRDYEQVDGWQNPEILEFGNYKVADKPYDKLGFSIHNYFFSKALNQVRSGGVVAFVTSRYTMDSKNMDARKYIAQRAELLGAIRLPNNAFKANAGTEVVSDIIFLQKRDHPIDIVPDWVHLNTTPDGFTMNSYFVEHPEMVLGELSTESTQLDWQQFSGQKINGEDFLLELG